MNSRIASLIGGSVGSLAVGGLLVYGGYNSLFQVEGGHNAVLFNRFEGVKDRIYGEGLHFKLPWFEWETIYETRTKPKQISSSSGTKDLQMINIKLRVLYRPHLSNLPDLHRRFGPQYDNCILPSILNETLKSVIAQFNAAQLLTQREEVSRLIRNDLSRRAKEFYIDLEDVSITHLSFGREYTAAVEAKQVAQQDAERAKFIVERAEQDKKSNIIRAQGEAKSAEMIGKALQSNPGFVELRRLEAAREIATTISKSNNKLFLSSGSLLLDLGQDQNEKKSTPAHGSALNPVSIE